MNIKRLTAIALGHFSIDVLNSSIAIILTVLSGKFDLTLGQIGLAAMIYTLAASLTQPLFGILADYLQGRWLGAISVAWTAIFYGLAAFAPSYPLLVALLTVGALGSGAFHPVGMINAAAAGGNYPTTATSIFFLLGQSGLAVGPMAAGLLLQYVDITVGLPLLALGMIPAILMMALYLNHPMQITVQTSSTAKSSSPPSQFASAQQSPSLARLPNRSLRSHQILVAIAFILIIALRSATIQGFVTLLPKYFDDLGYQSGEYGIMIGILAFAGAIGTFFGGYLGDKVNRRLTIFVSLLLSIPFSLALLYVEGWLFYPIAGLAGALLNIPHSILLIMAQRLLPKREGLMGGATLGFMFASGAIMTAVASQVATWIGLPMVLVILAILPIGAALSALILPPTRQQIPAATPTNVQAAAD